MRIRILLQPASDSPPADQATEAWLLPFPPQGQPVAGVACGRCPHCKQPVIIKEIVIEPAGGEKPPGA